MYDVTSPELFPSCFCHKQDVGSRSKIVSVITLFYNYFDHTLIMID